MFDDLSQSLIDVAYTVINIFPTTPFTIIDEMGNTVVYEYLQYVNWFIDFSTIMNIFAAWLTCVAIYYVYQIVLRWIKVIE